MSGASQQRALEFEKCIQELFQRLVEDDLGWELTQSRLQSPGPQHGKDIQLAWRADGREYRWHIECKSHLRGTLRKEEVMPKLFDLWRSKHRIDVWCLALANIEPGQAVDEFLPAAREMLNLPFGITVLSRAEHGLPDLFACYPDLFKRVYPRAPRFTLSKDTRDQRIEAFGAFLLDQSLRPREPRGEAWTLVTPEAPERMGIPPDEGAAAIAYLRGLSPCHWDSVAYDWAIQRPSAVDPMVRQVTNSKAGTTFCWCIGAAGEGKTTVARAAAWHLAGLDSRTCVLWAEAEWHDVEIPLRWINALDSRTRVVLFIDGTRRLGGLSSLASQERFLQSQGRHVICVLIDRGVAHAHSPARRELERRRARAVRLDVPPLEKAEIDALIARLDERGILTSSPAKAKRRLTEASTREIDKSADSWLLPTMLEITDPEERGFERILGDFLEQVGDADPAALSLLLAAALAHAARVGLPARFAERLAPAGQYGQAMATLQSEMHRELLPASSQPITEARLLTYSVLVAEGFLLVGGDSKRSSLEETCRRLVEIGGQHAAGQPIPRQGFELLHQITNYLLDELQDYELCARWLEEQVRLDDPPIDFVAQHRLGDCLVDWVKHALQSKSPKTQVHLLADRARAAFLDALEMAERVLPPDGGSSPRWPKITLDQQRRACFRSWAILEGIEGQHFRGEQALLQSSFLAILGLASGSEGVRATSILALSLIEQERFEPAAVVAGVAAEMGARKETRRRQHQLLSRKGFEIPEGAIDQFGDVVSRLSAELLKQLGPEDWPHADEARRRRLLEAIPTIQGMLPRDCDSLSRFAADLATG